MFRIQRYILILFIFLGTLSSRSQVANYIANGSFEEVYDCDWPYYLTKVKSWLSIDSFSFGGSYFSACRTAVPSYGDDIFQYARTGDAYILSTFYYYPNNTRGYLKNRLKKNLQAGTTYCIKFHVNIRNSSPCGMDGFGIYFGDNTIDTITKCNIALNYINPQVKNPLGNIITDTLNWVPITGTFTANGTEKYALIGNFLSDAALTTSIINPAYLPLLATDVGIDDVSCIPLDLPAFAGNDTSCIPGTSVYIGRPRDVGIDEACTWYKLPMAQTDIGTKGAGLWVSPITTSTYVVKQEICGNVKWDTVVVREEPLGVNGLNIKEDRLKIYPVPAKDELNLQFDNSNTNMAIAKMFNSLGEAIWEGEVIFKGHRATIKTDDLLDGIHFLEINFNNQEMVRKRFSITTK